MMFLLRLAFWLTLVLLVLPMPDDREGPVEADAAPQPQASVVDVIGVAQSAISDAAGFCMRNPRTCQTGIELAGTLREKAQYGAQLVYEYLSDEPIAPGAPSATEVAAPVEAAPQPEVATPVQPTIDTLSEEDRQISWRGSING